jgi:hypothetical protein
LRLSWNRVDSGLNNLYHTNAGTERAIAFNDQSVQVSVALVCRARCLRGPVVSGFGFGLDIEFRFECRCFRLSVEFGFGIRFELVLESFERDSRDCRGVQTNAKTITRRKPASHRLR